MATTDLYTVRSSPGKGIGVFANTSISPGTVIMRDITNMLLERPQLDVTDQQVNEAFAALSLEDKKAFMALHDSDLPYTNPVMRIYKANCFGDETHSWIFLKFSRVNHSCDPNAEVTCQHNVDDTEIVALRPISKDEEVLISYLGPFLDGPRSQRRMMLKGTYRFDCMCATCSLTGHAALISDMRRHLINVLSHRQQGFEPSPLRYSAVAGMESTQGKTLASSKQPLKIPLTGTQKVLHNFLLAKLLEAEGRRDFTVAQAYAIAAFGLMGQMQQSKPFVVIPSAVYLMEWIDKARTTMRAVRSPELKDVKELEKACRDLESNSYVLCAKAVVDKEGKDAVFATIFGEPGRYLTQSECLVMLRRVRASALAVWEKRQR